MAHGEIEVNIMITVLLYYRRGKYTHFMKNVVKIKKGAPCCNCKQYTSAASLFKCSLT